MTRALVTAMIAAGIMSSCQDGSSVAFRPVYRQGDQLIMSDDPMAPKMRENVIHVLRFYHVKHREDASGAILVPRNVASDLDTMWNYTTKARDEVWLREHPLAGDR